MVLNAISRYFSGAKRRRRYSYYSRQLASRRVVKGEFCFYTDKALKGAILTETDEYRLSAAIHELCRRLELNKSPAGGDVHVDKVTRAILSLRDRRMKLHSSDKVAPHSP